MVQWCTTLWERLWLVRYTKKLVSYIQIDLHRFIIRVASGNRVSGQITGHGKTDLWTKLSNDSLKRWHLNFQFYCKMTSNDSDNGPDISDLTRPDLGVRELGKPDWGGRTDVTSFSEPVNSPRDDFKKRNRGIKYLREFGFWKWFQTVLFNFNLNQGGI